MANINRSWAVDPVNGVNAVYSPSMAGVAITAATKANPCQITSASHGLIDGDYIRIDGVVGMTQLNGNYFTVTYVDENNFTLNGINSTAYGTYTSGGTWFTAIKRSNPCEITQRAHGFSPNQIVYISAAAGMTQIAGTTVMVDTVLSANRYTVKGFDGTPINSTSYSLNTIGNTIYAVSKIINSITKANPAVVTATSHGFSNGNKVYISCTGMTEMDKCIVTVANATTDTFECSGVDSSAFATFTEGTVQKPFLSLNYFSTLGNSAVMDNSGFWTHGDYVYCAQTWKDDTSVEISPCNFTFTYNSTTVNTSSSCVGIISVGDYIGKTTAVGTGWDGDMNNPPEIFHRVTAVGATTITIASRYNLTTGTVGTISRLRQGTEIRDVNTGAIGWVWYYKPYATIEGGYDFSGGVITRNGETWISPVTKTANSYSLGLGASVAVVLGLTFKYFGLVNGETGFDYVDTTYARQFSVENCHFCCTQAGYYIPNDGYPITYPSYFKNCTCAIYGTAAGQGFVGQRSAAIEYRNNYFLGNYSTYDYRGLDHYTVSVADLISYDCYFHHCNIGVNMGPRSLSSGHKFVSCAQGIYLNTSSYGTKIEDCDFVSCASGCYYYNVTVTELWVKDCTFDSCSYGHRIRSISPTSWLFENNTYSSCGRDIYNETNYAMSGLVIAGHTSTTPGTYAIDFNNLIHQETVRISDFSIDAPSISKAIGVIQVWSGIATPSYTMVNCPQFAEGSYYYYLNYVKDPTTYRTSGSSMKINFGSTGYVTYQRDIPIYSTYAKAGVARTLTVYIQRHASMAGSLTPVWRLNKRIIQTETDISHADIGTTWTQFVWTVPALSIPNDGELQLGFKMGIGTAQPVWLDDFTIT